MRDDARASTLNTEHYSIMLFRVWGVGVLIAMDHFIKFFGCCDDLLGLLGVEKIDTSTVPKVGKEEYNH
jgi:hypothetical protein